MKTLFLAFILCLGVIAPAHAIIGNIGHSTNLDYAKAVVPESVEKLFINVKSSAAIAAGQVASLDLTADDGATALVGPTTGLAPLCIMVNACASGALCKCQTYGLYDTALFDLAGGGSAVAGKRAFMSTANAGYVSARVTDLATEIPVGFFYDAAAASGSVQLFIKL
jgi:hypothetical protein